VLPGTRYIMFPLIVLAQVMAGACRTVCAAETDYQPAAAAQTIASIQDAAQLFATTCGWCHSDAGRAAGKGPKLMGTERTDDFIRARIKNGKEGAMPAFGAMLNDADIDVIISYIRSLKPEE
jgi:mono/diheme cytochrome c family protein